ncbi:Immunity protein 53 [Myxococcus fulvus]|nr:immunity 53 family protein [Myxococcus fulvus]SET06073.1 Immunity protein 53 [Myxococcus fulvus]
MDVLAELQAWMASHCDGEWEHQYGVTIDTLDNPGWSVKIDLKDTKLLGVAFEEKTVDRSEKDWLACRVREATFEGYGGVFNLREILEVFLGWANASGAVPRPT